VDWEAQLTRSAPHVPTRLRKAVSDGSLYRDVPHDISEPLRNAVGGCFLAESLVSSNRYVFSNVVDPNNWLATCPTNRRTATRGPLRNRASFEEQNSEDS